MNPCLKHFTEEMIIWLKENGINERAMESQYDDMLDDCYPVCKIANYSYCTSRALKEVDPVAYNCGLADYCSEYLEVIVNGWIYYFNDNDQEEFNNKFNEDLKDYL